MYRSFWFFVVTIVAAAFAGQATAAETWTIRPDGLGPIHVGMTIAAISKAISQPLKLDARDPDAAQCSQMTLPGNEDVVLLFEHSRFSSVSIYADNGPSPFLTQRGIGIGATESELRTKYPHLEKGRSTDDADWTSLTYSDAPHKLAIVFFIDKTSHVVAVFSGNESVFYDEGCA